jgi:hypothetical protein
LEQEEIEDRSWTPPEEEGATRTVMSSVEGTPAGFVETGSGMESAWLIDGTRDYYRYKCAILDAALPVV